MAFLAMSALVIVVLLATVGTACQPSESKKVVTFGQYADEGKAVFTQNCAKCHGDQGQGGVGPAIMGTSATLQKFDTAQGLNAFITVAMPMDAPGTLSPQDYQRVLGYLMVQNGFAVRDTPFNAEKLQDYQLKR